MTLQHSISRCRRNMRKLGTEDKVVDVSWTFKEPVELMTVTAYSSLLNAALAFSFYKFKYGRSTAIAREGGSASFEPGHEHRFLVGSTAKTGRHLNALWHSSTVDETCWPDEPAWHGVACKLMCYFTC